MAPEALAMYKKVPSDPEPYTPNPKLGCELWAVRCEMWGVGCGVWGVVSRVWGVGFGV